MAVELTFSERSRQLQPAPNAVRATDYRRLPDWLRQHMAPVVSETPVAVAELESFLEQDRTHKISWTDYAPEGLLFPKIAVCSWKEWPWLLPFDRQSGIELFHLSSERMRIVLSAWIMAREPVWLRFFAHQDHTQANEYRFHSGTSKPLRTVTRHGHDGQGPALELAKLCASALLEQDGMREDCLIDIATWQAGHSVRTSLVEINPLAPPRTAVKTEFGQ